MRCVGVLTPGPDGEGGRVDGVWLHPVVLRTVDIPCNEYNEERTQRTQDERKNKYAVKSRSWIIWVVRHHTQKQKQGKRVFARHYTPTPHTPHTPNTPHATSQTTHHRPHTTHHTPQAVRRALV